MCRVLNKRVDGVPAGAVYIGRGSKWVNPFVIGRDGDRAEVIAKYARCPPPPKKDEAALEASIGGTFSGFFREIGPPRAGD